MDGGTELLFIFYMFKQGFQVPAILCLHSRLLPLDDDVTNLLVATGDKFGDKRVVFWIFLQLAYAILRFQSDALLLTPVKIIKHPCFFCHYNPGPSKEYPMEINL